MPSVATSPLSFSSQVFSLWFSTLPLLLFSSHAFSFTLHAPCSSLPPFKLFSSCFSLFCSPFSLDAPLSFSVLLSISPLFFLSRHVNSRTPLSSRPLGKSSLSQLMRLASIMSSPAPLTSQALLMSFLVGALPARHTSLMSLYPPPNRRLLPLAPTPLLIHKSHHLPLHTPYRVHTSHALLPTLVYASHSSHALSPTLAYASHASHALLPTLVYASHPHTPYRLPLCMPRMPHTFSPTLTLYPPFTALLLGTGRTSSRT